MLKIIPKETDVEKDETLIAVLTLVSTFIVTSLFKKYGHIFYYRQPSN